MLKPLICAALLAFVATPAAALTFVTEEAPPYNFTEGGKVTGLSTQVLQEAARRAGVPVKVEVVTSAVIEQMVGPSPAGGATPATATASSRSRCTFSPTCT